MSDSLQKRMESNQIGISLIADEAAESKQFIGPGSLFPADLTPEGQLEAVKKTKLRCLDLRMVQDSQSGNPINFNLLPQGEVERIGHLFRDAGYSFVCNMTGIGKSKLIRGSEGPGSDFQTLDEVVSAAEKACKYAQCIGASMVRVFGFYPPLGAEVSSREWSRKSRPRLSAIADVAERRKMLFVLENEAFLANSSTPTEVYRILKLINCRWLKAALDVGNAVHVGLRPDEILAQAEPLIKEGWLASLHLKDLAIPSWMMDNIRACKVTPYTEPQIGRYHVMAGQGNGGLIPVLKCLKPVLPEINKELQALGHPGLFAAIEGHLNHGGTTFGNSGVQGVNQIYYWTVALLAQLEISVA
jgi:sugar phosphate isomerase/epimerase